MKELPEDFVYLPGYLDRMHKPRCWRLCAPVWLKPRFSRQPCRRPKAHVGPHDKFWRAWLGDGQGTGIPLSANASGHWQAMARHAGRPSRHVARACELPERAGSLPCEFLRARGQDGPASRSRREEFAAPVLSISLGDTCLFRIGGEERAGPAASLKLSSGDVVLLAGKSRLAFHGVTRIYPGTSTLLKGEGRVNLTLRRVNP